MTKEQFFWGLIIIIVLLGGHDMFARNQALTDVEQLKLANIGLQAQLAKALADKSDCLATLGPLQAQRNSEAINQQLSDIKLQIEASHPGWELDVATGKLSRKVEAGGK